MTDMDLKRCPLCTNDLPIAEFGICRARKDGRNLYCKSCIRQKVTASRKALKEYKSVRRKYQPVASRFVDEAYEPKPARKLSPVERVKEAIKNGAKTQRQIATETRLTNDEIGDAIANLLLWTKEIRTIVIEGKRMYFVNEVEERPPVEYPAVDPWETVTRKANRLVVQGERRIQKVA